MSTAPQSGGESDRIAVWEGSTVIGYVSAFDVTGVTRWHSWKDLEDTVGCGSHQDQAQAERYLRTLAEWASLPDRRSLVVEAPPVAPEKPVKKVGRRRV